jgi:hypothetical protein
MATRVSRRNLMHSHPSAEVRGAVIQLADALTQYERSTGRAYLVIVKVDSAEGPFEYRSLCGGPASERDPDDALSEAFENMLKPA